MAFLFFSSTFVASPTFVLPFTTFFALLISTSSSVEWQHQTTFGSLFAYTRRTYYSTHKLSLTIQPHLWICQNRPFRTLRILSLLCVHRVLGRWMTHRHQWLFHPSCFSFRRQLLMPHHLPFLYSHTDSRIHSPTLVGLRRHPLQTRPPLSLYPSHLTPYHLPLLAARHPVNRARQRKTALMICSLVHNFPSWGQIVYGVHVATTSRAPVLMDWNVMTWFLLAWTRGTAQGVRVWLALYADWLPMVMSNNDVIFPYLILIWMHTFVGWDISPQILRWLWKMILLAYCYWWIYWGLGGNIENFPTTRYPSGAGTLLDLFYPGYWPERIENITPSPNHRNCLRSANIRRCNGYQLIHDKFNEPYTFFYHEGLRHAHQHTVHDFSIWWNFTYGYSSRWLMEFNGWVEYLGWQMEIWLYTPFQIWEVGCCAWWWMTVDWLSGFRDLGCTRQFE